MFGNMFFVTKNKDAGEDGEGRKFEECDKDKVEEDFKVVSDIAEVTNFVLTNMNISV